MSIEHLKMRLFEINQQINTAKNNKSIGLILMIVSIFFLWPLLIVGIIMYISNDKKINELEIEKRRIQWEIRNNDIMNKTNNNDI